MGKNEIIAVNCFGIEIGRLGYDEDKKQSSFQYNPDFLNQNLYPNLFPSTGILKKTKHTQVFTQYNSETFRGLPPFFADSLPDLFGNIIFKKWLESSNKEFKEISVLEQLAYVSNRGMGALEYYPAKKIPQDTNIDLSEIIHVLKQVLNLKDNTKGTSFNQETLLTIFKIGSSAGGARPKILISEHKKEGIFIPGDLNHSDEYIHYLVKLSIEDELGYSKETIEYCYYLTAIHLGINMMPSKLIDNKHFATERFDRQNGKKIHTLTASGLTGWDFQLPTNSSYENLFELALYLKVPQIEIDELFKRMIFNLVFCNTDDHLKNHSFIYNEKSDKWKLSPAYDLTYSLNPILNYKRVSRALSINKKRIDIQLEDVLNIADNFSVKNPTKIISEVQDACPFWTEKAIENSVPPQIIEKIKSNFISLLK